MKTQELRSMSMEQLKAKAEEKQKEAEQLRFVRHQGKEKNVNHLKNVRHDLARILTIITENEKRTHSLKEKP